METKDLSIFVRACELGNLTQAAEEAGYSPSAGSHIIKRLEKSLGVCLLVRDRSGVGLSAEGRIIFPLAKKLMADQAALERAADALLSEFTGELRVGSISSVAVQWLPGLISEFHKLYPGVRIKVIEGNYEEVEEWLIDKKVECGFLSSRVKRSFDIWPLRDDPLHAVLREDHPLAAMKRIPLKMLKDKTILAPYEGVEYDVGKMLKDYSLPTSTFFDSISDYSALFLVKNGYGLTIMPELLLHDLEINGIITRPLIPECHRTICIAAHRSEKRSAIAQRFIDYVVEWSSYSASE